MSRPFLSIVTITKDDPVGLERTLVSVRTLYGAGVEQVVIDGSATAPSASRFWEPGNTALIVRARPARGIADAFNAGLAVATGEWVWFLNGGDCIDPGLDPGFLQKLLERTDADIVIGGITYEGESRPREVLHPGKRWPPLRSWIPHPSTLVRRRLFEQFGNFDERYSIAMDYEWFLRVLLQGIAVEMQAASFAVFAKGGISQQPDLFERIRLEHNDAIRRHHWRLWRPSPYVLYRLMRAFLSARLGPDSV